MIECRHFSGYKPCGKNAICDSLCPSLSVPTVRVLIVHLEALGAVLRSTSLLAGIRRKYPDAHVTWVTQKPADQLLRNNPCIDRVLTTERDDLLALSALRFDVGLCVDKSLKAMGVMGRAGVDRVYGFKHDGRTGAILPATAAASELWELGLDDHRKFHVNQKPETRLSREALELPGVLNGSPEASDEYVVALTEAESREAAARRRLWKGPARALIGINTGCSSTIPHKKLSIETHRALIRELAAVPGVRIALLGGGEDELRNQRIAHGLGVVRTPTGEGLRDGLISVQACDIVVTGDSLGMHMAIATKKWVVAWFGPTCAQEIELYGRGVKVTTTAGCAPCWKRECAKSPMCHDLVPLAALKAGVVEGLARLAPGTVEPARKDRFVTSGSAPCTADPHSPDGVRRGPAARDPAPETPAGA